MYSKNGKFVKKKMEVCRFDRYSSFSQRNFEAVSDSEELEMIETASGCSEYPSDSFYLPSGVDEGFGVPGFWDLGISQEKSA